MEHNSCGCTLVGCRGLLELRLRILAADLGTRSWARRESGSWRIQTRNRSNAELSQPQGSVCTRTARERYIAAQSGHGLCFPRITTAPTRVCATHGNGRHEVSSSGFPPRHRRARCGPTTHTSIHAFVAAAGCRRAWAEDASCAATISIGPTANTHEHADGTAVSGGDEVEIKTSFGGLQTESHDPAAAPATQGTGGVV